MAIIQARVDQSRSPARPLNSRQTDTLFLICKGLRNAEIATQLHVSERTVKGYVAQLLLIFDVTNRTELVARAFEMNILKDSEDGIFARDGSTIGRYRWPVRSYLYLSAESAQY